MSSHGEEHREVNLDVKPVNFLCSLSHGSEVHIRPVLATLQWLLCRMENEIAA